MFYRHVACCPVVLSFFVCYDTTCDIHNSVVTNSRSNPKRGQHLIFVDQLRRYDGLISSTEIRLVYGHSGNYDLTSVKLTYFRGMPSIIASDRVSRRLVSNLEFGWMSGAISTHPPRQLTEVRTCMRDRNLCRVIIFPWYSTWWWRMQTNAQINHWTALWRNSTDWLSCSDKTRHDAVLSTIGSFTIPGSPGISHWCEMWVSTLLNVQNYPQKADSSSHHFILWCCFLNKVATY